MYEDINNRFLKRSSNVFEICIDDRRMITQIIPNGCFQSAETEIIPVIYHRSRKCRERFISIACKFIDYRSRRISEPHHLTNLIKCLPCCIIKRPTEYLISANVGDKNQECMPAADDKCKERKLRYDRVKIDAEYMCFDMMNADERYIERKRKSFCKIHTDQK